MTIVVDKVPRRRRPKLTKEEETLVLALRADGLSNEAIADEVIRRRKAKKDSPT